MRRKVGLLVRFDVSYEDVEITNVESGIIDCYDFLRNVLVDPQEIEPDRLTCGRYVRFFKTKDNVQSSDRAFLTVYIDRAVAVNPSWLTVKGMAADDDESGEKAMGMWG